MLNQTKCWGDDTASRSTKQTTDINPLIPADKRVKHVTW